MACAINPIGELYKTEPDVDKLAFGFMFSKAISLITCSNVFPIAGIEVTVPPRYLPRVLSDDILNGMSDVNTPDDDPDPSDFHIGTSVSSVYPARK